MNVSPSERVRILGVLFDSHLTMVDQVGNVCRKAYASLKSIGALRKYLDKVTTERLVHAFITSHLDNCNSVLYGLPEVQISKLQRVQNSAARLIEGARRRDHIQPILYNLHWLPIRKRVLFKMLLIVYKSLTFQSPDYIFDILVPYAPSRPLRSSNKHLLQIPHISRKSKLFYGSRAFSIAAPTEWNSLPDLVRNASNVQSFKSLLKTHLFTQ